MPETTEPQLTEAQVAEIEARANAASSAPWLVTDGQHIDQYGHHPDGNRLLSEGSYDANYHVFSAEDVAFIAHARTDIPALIRDWRALRGANELLEANRKMLAQGVEDGKEYKRRYENELENSAALREQLAAVTKELNVIRRRLTSNEREERLLQQLVETPAGERIRMKCGAADLRSVITDVLAALSVTAPVSTGDDAEERARKLVDDFRYASPPVQSLRFLEWEPLVASIAEALRSHESPTTSTTPVDEEQNGEFGPRSHVDDWPIVDVLGHLASATEHLLQHHNCDEHGHEIWKYAAEAAWKHVALLNKPATTPTAVTSTTYADGFCAQCSELAYPLTRALEATGVPTGADGWQQTYGPNKVRALSDHESNLRRLLHAIEEGDPKTIKERVEAAKHFIEFHAEVRRRLTAKARQAAATSAGEQELNG